jgi:RHS repeat-associated protein
MRILEVGLRAALILAASTAVSVGMADDWSPGKPAVGAEGHPAGVLAQLRLVGDSFEHADGVRFELRQTAPKSGQPGGWPFHCPSACPGPSLEPPIKDATTTDYGLGASLYLDGETPLIKHRFIDGSGNVRHSQAFSLSWPDICGEGVYYAPFVFGGGVCLSPGSVDTWWRYPHGSPGRWKWQLLVGNDEVIKEVEFEMRPALIHKISGDGASGVVGEALREPLVVRLTDISGNPVNYPRNGHTRAFEATIRSPGGARGASVTTTYPTVDGRAPVHVVLGDKAGTYRVEVTHPEAGDAKLTFTLSAVERLEPDDQEEQEEEVGEDPCAKFVGNPISVGIGNKLEQEVDYPRTGLSPLEFVRTYNAFGSRSSLTRNYWSTSFDRFVVLSQVAGGPVRLRRPDGRTIRFQQVGDQLVSKPFFSGRLERTAAGFRYTDTDGSVETFDADGKWLSSVDLHGRTLTAEYRRQTGRLIRVSANTGESLSLAYDSHGQLSRLTDHTGRSWAYRYNGYANLVGVDEPDGVSRTYLYEDSRNPWLLTGVAVSPAGSNYTPSHRLVSWFYDAEGRATRSVYAHHVYGQDLRQVDIAYADDGTRTVSDSMGNTTEYRMLDVGGRQFVERIDGAAAGTCGSDLALEYDDDMNIVAETRFGTRTEYGDHDTRRQPGFVIHGAGTALALRTDIEYDPRFFERPTRIVEPSVASGNFRVTEIDYNAAGDPVEVRVDGYRPDGTAISRTLRYEYQGPFGQLSRVEGPRSDVADDWRFEHHPNSKRLHRVIDPNGIVVRDNIQYSATGNIFAEDRPNGLRLAYTYHPGSDRLASLTESQGGLSRTTLWTYDQRGRVRTMRFGATDGPTHLVTFTYDLAGDLIRIDSAGEGSLTLQRDRDGNILRTSTPSHWVERTYDAYRRVDQVINPNNTYDYDFHPDGRLRLAEDGKGQATEYSYDDLLRLSTVTQPGGIESHFRYDVRDNLTRVLAGNQASTEYAYDDLGNLLIENSPDRGLTQYTHDAAGHVVARIDAKGQTTTYAYDAGGRLLAVDRPGNDYDESYAYDDCPNGTGRLCSIVNGLGEYVAFEYDGLGRVAAQIQPDGELLNRHDPAGRVIEITYPSGRTVEIERTVDGRATRMRLREHGVPHLLLDQVQYAVLGPLVSWRFANGLVHHRTRDLQYWPVRFGTDGVTRLDYVDFDGNGNIERIDVDGTPHRYAYDEQDRLTRFTPPWADIGYAYDPVGNRTRLDDHAAATSVPYAYQPASNRIQGDGARSHVLDANGNTIGRSGLDADGVDYAERFDYSVHNRLTGYASRRPSSAPWTEHAQYRYNPLGQRVAKTVDGVTTRFVYGLNGQLLAELDEAGSVLQEYVYLDGIPVAVLGAPTPPPPPMPEQPLVEDNQAASGRWTVRSDNKALGGSYLYLPDNDPQAPHTHTWTWDVPVAGSYRVEITWLAPNNSGITTQRYRMAGTSFDIARNGVARGAWVGGRNFELAAGAVTLELSEAFNPGQRLFADAARLIPMAAATEAPEVHYLHSDHLNTPRALTDSTGSVVWRAAYDAFGAATVDADPDGDGTEATLNLRFPGQYFDQETGLHYNYFRTYDPSTGRYLESDPIGLAGGVNTFAYASGNPILVYDPLGLFDVYARPQASAARGERIYSVEFYTPFSGRVRDARQSVSDLLRGGPLTGATEAAQFLKGQPTGVSDLGDSAARRRCDELDAFAKDLFEKLFGQYSSTRTITEQQLRDFISEVVTAHPELRAYYPADTIVTRANRRAHGARD